MQAHFSVAAISFRSTRYVIYKRCIYCVFLGRNADTFFFRRGFHRISYPAVVSVSFGSVADILGEDFQDDLYVFALRRQAEKEDVDMKDKVIAFVVDGSSDLKRYLLRDVLGTKEWKNKLLPGDDKLDISEDMKQHLRSLIMHARKARTTAPSQFVGNEGEWDFEAQKAAVRSFERSYQALLSPDAQKQQEVAITTKSGLPVTIVMISANAAGHEVIDRCVKVNRSEQATQVKVLTPTESSGDLLLELLRSVDVRINSTAFMSSQLVDVNCRVVVWT